MGRKRIIPLRSGTETAQLGEDIAPFLKPNTLLTLQGDLGAGKTTFIQGLSRGLKIQDPILSPTYVYLNLYKGTLPLFHFDLYRLKNGDDFFALGFEEYLEKGGISAIEWPEKVLDHLPRPLLALYFSYGDSINERLVTVEIDETTTPSLLQCFDHYPTLENI